ncbi:Bug family tripartite tricarboxylate transporter substrate binding protein [Rhodoplanes sp. Z2-YC6860]|uniref:Bug family tripartite tricarboxylate transporter substrate binding protein n=1 Tax=Rhodoplanes sp. Z2-YC6860 TaxID=674703 RepID=UPI00078C7C00|nr:tripartite tricarboxylate transporter substrate binding protein [Rhodoplanes sp. Z2-YC6860]AMN39468.1 extra-cytoplasmic solute receptor protein [Rhodoplanes sp. Z2-YC6860]
MLKRRDFLQLSAGGIAAALAARPAAAQGNYPDRAIKLVVPRAAGGVVDIIAREWSGKVKGLGTVYIENMGGGGGVIGATFVSRAPADGYTLLVGTTSELVISPLLGKQPYDPVTSFEPIAIMCDSPAAIVVHPSIPVSNLKELVAYAKQHKNGLSYGSAGAGTVSNLAGELFKEIAGLQDIVHVPYKGGAPAVSDAIAGQIPISTPMMSEQIWELHRQGKLKVLAVASEKRLRAIPDLPTAVEQGFPDLVARLFFGLFAPAKTPKEIIGKVEQATKVAMQDPELRKNFEAGGFETLDTTDAAAAADYVAKEVTRWKPILAQFKPQ